MYKCWLKIMLTGVCLCSLSARAELRIEVTKGIDNAVRVAVVPFAWPAITPLAENVSQIVKSDLQLSGRFDTLPVDQMLSLPSQPADVIFRDWRMLNVEYLVIGSLRPRGDKIELEFALYNVYKQSLVASHRIEGTESELRDMGHHVSDVVFERLTGIAGAFSTRILYVTALGPIDNREFRLNVADADGNRMETILSSKEPILSAVWGPKGEKIAYVSYELDSKPAIYVRDFNTNVVQQITNFAGLNGAPAFSPDGTQMAMVLSKDGNPNIYVMDLATRRMRRITRHYAIDTEPNWTPDGQHLIFTSNRGGSPQIYQIALSNLQVERLTFEGDYNARASLLPDGKSMIMVHRREDVFHIALMDLERGRLSVLTETSLDESPSIAPNGSMLIYATQVQDQGILAAVSIDGGVKFNLPSSEGDVREPAWSPGKRRKFEPLK